MVVASTNTAKVLDMTKSRTVVLTNEERDFLVSCLEDHIEDCRTYLKDSPLDQSDRDEQNESMARAYSLIAKLPPL